MFQFQESLMPESQQNRTRRLDSLAFQEPPPVICPSCGLHAVPKGMTLCWPCFYERATAGV